MPRPFDLRRFTARWRNPARPHRFATAALLLGVALWGLNWWPIKRFAAAGINSAEVTAVGFSMLTLMSLPCLWKQRARWSRQPWLATTIVLLPAWSNFAFIEALAHGQVTRVVMLFYLAPIWGLLGGWLFLHEPLGWRRGSALALAMAGASLMLGVGRDNALATPLGPPDAYAVSAGVAFALANVAVRASTDIPIGSKAALAFCGSAALAWLVVLLQYGISPNLQGVTLLALLVYGLTWLAAANFGVLYGVMHMELGRASVLLVLEVLVAVASATLIGGEVLTWLEWFGGALIIGSALTEALSVP